MSTVTTRDTVIQSAKSLPADPQPVPVERKRGGSALSRLFTWYREAVLRPATEKEKAEWQQDSF